MTAQDLAKVHEITYIRVALARLSKDGCCGEFIEQSTGSEAMNQARVKGFAKDYLRTLDTITSAKKNYLHEKQADRCLTQNSGLAQVPDRQLKPRNRLFIMFGSGKGNTMTPVVGHNEQVFQPLLSRYTETNMKHSALGCGGMISKPAGLASPSGF